MLLPAGLKGKKYVCCLWSRAHRRAARPVCHSHHMIVFCARPQKLDHVKQGSPRWSCSFRSCLLAWFARVQTQVDKDFESNVPAEGDGGPEPGPARHAAVQGIVARQAAWLGKRLGKGKAAGWRPKP
eukprot:10012098-Alexandrium_andersonii.AAC.1